MNHIAIEGAFIVLMCALTVIGALCWAAEKREEHLPPPVPDSRDKQAEFERMMARECEHSITDSIDIEPT